MSGRAISVWVFSVATAALLLKPLALSAAAQSAPASAERVRGGILDASDANRLSRFMTSLGYRADLSTDASGDPAIEGRISSTDYAIQFYECENGEFCNSVQFIADTPLPIGKSVEDVNAFNMRWRYVRASISENIVRLQMDVNLDGGVTAGNIEDTLDIWRRLVETFEKEFSSKSPGQ